VIVGRRTFYNNCSFDGDNTALGTADDAAVATDKSALLPGQTATSANFTTFFHGINGLMVDIAGVPNPANLVASDFIFRAGAGADPGAYTPAPAPAAMLVRQVPGATRTEFAWADGAIVNEWLQVTVKANTNTGLGAADVFYFGNLIGDANGNAMVSVADIAQTKAASGQAATVASATDFNRSSQVTIADIAIAKAYSGNSIPLITAPIAAPAEAASTSATAAPALLSASPESNLRKRRAARHRVFAER
jgi:hypothetical protein